MRAAALALLLAVAPLGPAAAQAHLVVITGLPGTPERRAAFDSTASIIVAAARSRLGMSDANVLRLDQSSSPAATADGIATALTALAQRAEPQATVFIVLLGHGSSLGDETRFNVAGPDLTADRMALLLRRFTTQEVVVVNTTSASGPWVEALAGPRRTIITATRSGSQRDATVFGRFFAAALAEEASDTDKDGRLSVLEAFDAARAGVERHYQSLRRLRTEHALLDDDGDGRGSVTAGAQGDGRRAALLFLDGTGVSRSGDPNVTALLVQRDSLHRRLMALRDRRPAMDSLSYERELEQVLIEIARTGRAIRQRQVSLR